MRRSAIAVAVILATVACNPDELTTNTSPVGPRTIPTLRTVDLNPGDDIQAAINNAGSNATIWLHGTHYVNGEIIIRNKTGLYIRGDGRASTLINFQNLDHSNMGFDIQAGTTTLDIAHMSIRGT